MKKRYVAYSLCLFAFLCLTGWGTFSSISSSDDDEPIIFWQTAPQAIPTPTVVTPAPQSQPVTVKVKAPTVAPTVNWLDSQASLFHSQAHNLNMNVLKVGLKAYKKAREEGLDDKGLLTIIDYSKPSYEPRLWVLDLKRNKVLFNTWVAHGKNSGEVTPTSFSNEFASLKTSLGVYLTDEPYEGHDGYSLRLVGLESGFNNNALQRKIVMHGAWYVGADVAKGQHRLGRSWGCPAVSATLAKPLINTIKDKTLIVMYAPDQHWLRNSTFLTG